VADVILGAIEPGGRLPMTWPGEERDVPVIDVTPRAGVLRYDEGIHIGYRAWLKAGAVPAYPFGSGGGYTRFAVGSATVRDMTVPEEGVAVHVRVANVGKRAGKHVLQVYAARADSQIDRPEKWLVGFTAVRLIPGASEDVVINVPRRAFAHWDESRGEWGFEPGMFDLHIARSVTDTDVVLPVVVDRA
jgi:beta-glucosidase